MLDKRKSRLGNVTINQQEYMLFEEIGRGAASICYRGMCEGKKYVVKEFYPTQIAERDISGRVVTLQEQSSEELFYKKKESFAKAAEFHKEKLHGIQQNDFLLVEEIDRENGFVVMNDTDGETLSEWAKKQQINDRYIHECVEIVKGIIDELEKYHKSGYVHLDLKAENIYKFNIENNQVLTRIFDFDSIQKIDTLYENIQSKTAHIHTTNECYGKEIEKINNHSVNNITKEMIVKLDYYAVAKILHYLFYGNYEKSAIDDDTPFEKVYGKCTVLNNYLYNLFKTLCANIENRSYSLENMKEYLDKLLFIIDNRKKWAIYSIENLQKKFKSRLMSDIETDGKHYTMQRGISAIEQIDAEYNRNLFLHGYDGGRGKTTAMQWLMFRRTGDVDMLYLYFPLRELRPFHSNTNNEDEEEIYEYVEGEICRQYMLKALPKNCTILLDGYNEIENKEVKKQFDIFLENAKEHKYRIIISGRYREKAFDDFMYCTLAGISDKEIKKRGNAMLYMNENLRTNPMIVDLYSGIDMKNIPLQAKGRLIGILKDDEIFVNSTGEALWNYFIIQIYEKSKGDERAEDEYEKYLFKILPKIADRVYEHSEPVDLNNAGLTNDDIKIFRRCNDLFHLLEFNKNEDEEGYSFVHQNYYEFFDAVNILRESEDNIVNITPLAAELMGSAYCEPIVCEDKIIVPKGNVTSYYGNGKEIIESDEEIRYAFGRNLILENLECMRGNSDVEIETVQIFIDNLPHHHMNFSNLNIGWLLPHDEVLYEELGWDYTEVFDGNKFLCQFTNYNSYPETYAIGYGDNFDNICFDGSYINLQDNAMQFITNCSFKNVNEKSILPCSILPKSLTIQVGNCIYTKDKKVLLDYIGPESGNDEIFLFEETNKIDEAFRMNCKNPDAKIINKGSHFILKGKTLYHEYGKQTILEFCQRDINRLEIGPRTTKINSYACAYCKNLISVRKYIPNNIKKICHHAFAYNTSLKEFIVPAADELDSEICAGCTSLEEIVIYADLYTRLDLSCVQDCVNLKEIRIKDYSYMRNYSWIYSKAYGNVRVGPKSKPIKKDPSDIEKNIDLYTPHSSDIIEKCGNDSGGNTESTGRMQRTFNSSSIRNEIKILKEKIKGSLGNSNDTVSLTKALNIPEDVVIYIPHNMEFGDTFGLTVMEDYE